MLSGQSSADTAGNLDPDRGIGTASRRTATIPIRRREEELRAMLDESTPEHLRQGFQASCMILPCWVAAVGRGGGRHSDTTLGP